MCNIRHPAGRVLVFSAQGLTGTTTIVVSSSDCTLVMSIQTGGWPWSLQAPGTCYFSIRCSENVRSRSGPGVNEACDEEKSDSNP